MTSGCHESITLDGLAESGWPDGPQPALDESNDRLLDDLPFSIPDASRDPLTAALLIGVRFNDIQENAPSDIAALVHVHNDPDDQPAHCLRQPGHDFAAGDQGALDACRDFILEQVAMALEGGDGDALDLTVTTEIRVFLAFRGAVRVPISRFGFHLGRALHALQDSFTHSYRDPEDGRVRHVLNWVDWVDDNGYDEARDGSRHLGRLDDCRRGITESDRRVRWATEASAALMAALVDDTGGQAGRLARAEAALEQPLSLAPDCAFGNRYCDASEPFEPTGCSASSPAGLAAVLLALLLLPLVRRRRPSAAILVLTALLAAPGDARAQQPAAMPASATIGATTDASLDRSSDASSRDDDPLMTLGTSEVGFSASAAASLDRGAGAASAGLRWNLPVWQIALGFDAEYNPWYSFDANRLAAGAFNAYGSVIVRWKVMGRWELRSTVQLGASVLLFDLVGVDKGATGIYAAINPLGVVLPINRKLRLVIEPLNLAMPTPKLRGLPFYYRQYRATVGIEWYPWNRRDTRHAGRLQP